MGDWYYARNGKQYGPVDRQTLSDLSAKGQLYPQDLVWTEGMANWSEARGVQGLFAPAGPAGASAAVAVQPVQTIPMNYYAPTGVEASYAGFWLRFVAWFIDAVITGVGSFIVGIFVGVIIALSMAGAGGATGSGADDIAGAIGQARHARQHPDIEKIADFN